MQPRRQDKENPPNLTYRMSNETRLRFFVLVALQSVAGLLLAAVEKQLAIWARFT